ncbi:MAG TPA: hypothetical protein VKR32_03575 [Puia sp.]|nr:hypothetical protein [Puia sp.]
MRQKVDCFRQLKKLQEIIYAKSHNQQTPQTLSQYKNRWSGAKHIPASNNWVNDKRENNDFFYESVPNDLTGDKQIENDTYGDIKVKENQIGLIMCGEIRAPGPINNYKNHKIREESQVQFGIALKKNCTTAYQRYQDDSKAEVCRGCHIVLPN